MAALPPVPLTVRLQLKHTFGGDTDLMFRIYVSYTGSAPTDAECTTFAGAVASAWSAHLASQICGNVDLVEVVAEDLSSASAGVGLWTGSDASSGGVWDGALSTASLINFQIARRYRGGKPRVYLPPMGSAALTSPKLWNSTYQGNMTTGFTAFITAILAAGWSGAGTLTQVNVSYYSGFTVFMTPSGRARNIPKLRTGGPVTDPVVGIACNAVPASVRKRLGKR